jgi:hypothetical protein
VGGVGGSDARAREREEGRDGEGKEGGKKARERTRGRAGVRGREVEGWEEGGRARGEGG